MIMRKITLFISIFFLACSLFGQNYLPYYILCNKADEEIYLEENTEALKSLQEAFGLVDYVHSFQYDKASKCAIEINDYENGYRYARKAILHGSKNKFFNKKKYKSFRKTKYYQTLIDSIPYYEATHLSSLNNNYIQLIDSLYFLDQNVVRKNRRVKGNYNLHDLVIPANRYDLDTLIFLELIEAIEKYGFPSEKIIGPKCYNKALLLIHHNFRKKRNEAYHYIVKNAVFNGEYLPYDYEGMYEQYSIKCKNKTFFTTHDKDLSESNLKRINANRLEYGLKGLSSIKIKRKGLSMISLW